MLEAQFSVLFNYTFMSRWKKLCSIFCQEMVNTHWEFWFFFLPYRLNLRYFTKSLRLLTSSKIQKNFPFSPNRGTRHTFYKLSHQKIDSYGLASSKIFKNKTPICNFRFNATCRNNGCNNYIRSICLR